ncbi:MAG: DUF4373 domain-containing protein [Veillonella sp.]|nr:DUF4373 domain-containing protein [Veillonella sp.]
MAKDVYYFSHDVNASNDPKIIVMKELCGVIAYAWWWILIEQLAVQEDYKLPMDKITFAGLAIAFGMKQNEANASSNEAKASKSKQAEAFINLLINECELLETDGEYFWSPSLIRRNLLRKNKQIEISRKRSEAGRLGGLKSAEQRSKTKQMLEANEANQAKGKERKGNNIERDTRAREDENPLSMFDDDEVKNKPIYDLYMKAIGDVSPVIKDRLDDLVESYGKERVIVAINTTADNGGNSIKYVETVTAGNLKKEVQKDFGASKHNGNARNVSRKKEEVDWQAEYERVHGKG